MTGDEVAEKRLRGVPIGTKVLLTGAELEKGSTAGPPLEYGSTLKVSANSIRRVKWHLKLGIYRDTIPPLPLSAARSNGGNINKTEVVILRRYPDTWLIDDQSGDKRRRTMSKRQRIKFFAEMDRKRESKIDSIVKGVTLVHLFYNFKPESVIKINLLNIWLDFNLFL